LGGRLLAAALLPDGHWPAARRGHRPYQGASCGLRPAAPPAAEGLGFSAYSPRPAGPAVPDRAGNALTCTAFNWKL